MKSTKQAPSTAPDLTPEARIRQILALSLHEESVKDADSLTLWSSLDCVEAVIACERQLGIPEIDDDLLLKCKTIGDIVELCLVQPV